MTARYQMHHIEYEPEWLVELNMLQHRTISRMQVTIATPEAYANAVNFLHAVSYEVNRMRRDLDTGGDSRVVSRKKKVKKRERRIKL